ncbi:hypothetical protein ACQPZQ_33790 [Pseudonocardia sp. CA-142604]|uniref:hypothetical protein n=1 Tax=Pseudonocardia sp. CA-142604 TaxID=3240024 RepID=UPI003D92B306
MLTVQRFVTGKRPVVAGDGIDSTHFETQSPDAVLREGKSPNELINYEIDHMDARTHAPDDVSLQISDDHTLAVHDTEREPKEFYASPRVLAESIKSLEQVNSDYTLVPQGARIKTEHGELSRITPTVRKEAQEAKASGFADLIKAQCIDVAKSVIGSHRMEVVLADSKPEPWSGNVGDDLAPRVTERVRAGERPGSAGAESDQPATTVPEQYGSALRERPDEADEAARAMGINNHAQPDVGEAFTTVSIGRDARIDYATAEPGRTSTDRTAVDVWNYHFAGVVARSLDGADQVTLENYTRDQQAQKALQQLEGKLLTEYREKTRGWIFNREGKTPTGAFESQRVAEMIKELGGTTYVKAQAEYAALGTDKLAWQRKWFFRMYGSKAGQRFHEQQYNSGQGDFVNPMTLRVRADRQTPGSSG